MALLGEILYRSLLKQQFFECYIWEFEDSLLLFGSFVKNIMFICLRGKDCREQWLDLFYLVELGWVIGSEFNWKSSI